MILRHCRTRRERRPCDTANFIGKQFHKNRAQRMATGSRSVLAVVQESKFVSDTKHTFPEKHTEEPIEVWFKKIDSSELIQS